MLRYTNDKNFIAVQSYLIIQENEVVKLKTVRMNGIFAIKISKTIEIKDNSPKGLVGILFSAYPLREELQPITFNLLYLLNIFVCILYI
jgi:hypothetical protein